MRSFMTGSMLVMALTMMATTGSAGEASPSASVQRPRVMLGPTLRVVGFHRTEGQAGTYGGGALGLAVDVENTASEPVSGVMVKLTSGDATMSGTLSIPAKSKRTLTLWDTEGLESSCEPRPYVITLTGMGAVSLGAAGSSTRQARVTPSCTFASTIEQTWNKMSPDRVDAEKNGNVYLSSPEIVSDAVCGKPSPTMKVSIISRAAKSSPSLIVQSKEWSGTGAVRAQTAAAFPLPAGESKTLLLAPVGNHKEPAAKTKLTIVDWTKSLGGRTSDGGIFVHTTRSCTLDFALL